MRDILLYVHFKTILFSCCRTTPHQSLIKYRECDVTSCRAARWGMVAPSCEVRYLFTCACYGGYHGLPAYLFVLFCFAKMFLKLFKSDGETERCISASSFLPKPWRDLLWRFLMQQHWPMSMNKHSRHSLQNLSENTKAEVQTHSLHQAHFVPSAHHVVGEDGQQQFQFIRVDVDVGLDCVPWPDGPALKHLATKSLVSDKIKADGKPYLCKII